MKTLQQEAAEYVKIKRGQPKDRVIAFIAGANSEYVKHQKIQAQIEVLEFVYSNTQLIGNIIRQLKETGKY